jgi:hypothetical protein
MHQDLLPKRARMPLGRHPRDIARRERLLLTPLALACISICVSCHWGASSVPHKAGARSVPPHRKFPADCTLCHLAEQRIVLRPETPFDHADQTGYRLQGAHAQASCVVCHNDRSPVRSYASRGCAGCHTDPHVSALGTNCESCHDQTNWTPNGSDARSVETRFHAIPAHSVPPCNSCHVPEADTLSPGRAATCKQCHP